MPPRPAPPPISAAVKEPPDKTRVALSHDAEFNWWCKFFDAPRPKLHEAIRAVGPTVPALKKYFGMR
jgi:hypothetical protein